MESQLNPEVLSYIVNNINYPIVIKNKCNWPLLKWTLEDWSSHLEQEKLPFRSKPARDSKEPFWERNCPTKKMTFQEFLDFNKENDNPKEWMYFDYKYIHQWFKPDSEIYKQINWESFGFPEAGAVESTLWVGSEGAHTPCHQDTYGRNIVLQVYGRKRWLLFPPECGGMRPSRVPYEESSIYSQLNFYSPSNMSEFGGLSGCKMVSLEPGDALIVPHKWWHFVEHVSPVGVTINYWIPCESVDVESRVEEALIRLIVAQICKDLPIKCLPYILNPNEDDLQKIPLSVNILQLETTVKQCLQQRSKKNNAKRIKLSHNSESNAQNSEENLPNVPGASGDNQVTNNKSKEIKKPVDMEGIIKSCNDILVVKEISKDELMNILKGNMSKHSNSECQTESASEDDETNGELTCDHFTSAIIRSLCQPTFIENVKNNLLNQYK